MRRCLALGLLGVLVACGARAAGESSRHARWPWLPAGARNETIEDRLAPPAGFVRERLEPGSDAAWLRRLPLEPAGTPVLLHTGQRKPRQDVHAAVLALDIGARDLQQCADTVIRLRAEYLFARGRAAEISFRFTSGDEVPFARWTRGERPRVRGSQVEWTDGGTPGSDWPSLRRYLDTIFAYAGTVSLARDLVPVSAGEVRPGDVFLEGGSPGHAVLVVDVARHPASGERAFLLVQGFMPAQSAHVLKDLRRTGSPPWFRLEPDGALHTPEWSFAPGAARRFAPH